MIYLGFMMTTKVDVVIDIETVIEPVTASDVERYMEEYEPPKNYKTAEAILRHKEKSEANAVNEIANDRRFSIGGKKMIACALATCSKKDGVNVWTVESYCGDDLGKICSGVKSFLDDCGEYRLVGWNHVGFDLPELVKSFKLSGTDYPNRKPSKWDLIDLCNYPYRKMKMKDVAKAFGLELDEHSADDIARLYNEQNWDAIRKYNENDVILTGQIFNATCGFFTF